MSVTPEIYPVFLITCKTFHMNIKNLYEIIKDRKLKMPKDSYVASLFRLGEDRIIQKVGEETTEVVIAAKNKNKKLIISEVTDLLFHLLVFLALNDITLSDIEKELEDRNNLLKKRNYLVK